MLGVVKSREVMQQLRRQFRSLYFDVVVSISDRIDMCVGGVGRAGVNRWQLQIGVGCRVSLCVAGGGRLGKRE